MLSINYDIDLCQYHTFQIHHQASALCTFDNAEDIIELIQLGKQKFKSILPIGEGSNLLFLKDFDGCIVKSTNTAIEIIEETDEIVIVKAGSGLVWDSFVEWCVKQGYYGIENLSLIPGTIGASAVQNIGAYGVEAANSIFRVEGIDILSLGKRTFENNECEFGYRNSIFKNVFLNRFIITDVYFKLSKIEKYHLNYGSVNQKIEQIGGPTLKNVRAAIIDIRNNKLPDPKIIGNAGSFFKNPVVATDKAQKLILEFSHMPHYEAENGKTKLAAGWLIDQCGLKGYSTQKGAAIHDKQALVLTNKCVKSGTDILELAQFIQKSVSDKFGVDLEPEVTIIG